MVTASPKRMAPASAVRVFLRVEKAAVLTGYGGLVGQLSPPEGGDGRGTDAQAPPVPGTGNAPVARRVISPYTSGSVVYSPSRTVLRLPW